MTIVQLVPVKFGKHVWTGNNNCFWNNQTKPLTTLQYTLDTVSSVSSKPSSRDIYSWGPYLRTAIQPWNHGFHVFGKKNHVFPQGLTISYIQVVYNTHWIQSAVFPLSPPRAIFTVGGRTYALQSNHEITVFTFLVKKNHVFPQGLTISV